VIEVVEPQRRSAEPRGIGALLDAFETPLALARLDGTIELANAAFRSWTGSTASDLAAVFDASLAEIVAALRSGTPHLIKASAKNARGRAIPVEYQLALIQRDGSELIAIEGRDLSRVHEKEAILRSFTRTIELNNGRLARQNEEIAAAQIATQRLLDSTDQGFATLDGAGNLLTARSVVFDRWFGAPPAGTSFVDVLRAIDPDAAARFELVWWQIQDVVLPASLLVEQLPVAMQRNGRYLRMLYKPEVDDAERLVSLLVVISDATEELARSRAELRQLELRNLLAEFLSDRAGFIEFLAEGDALVAAITSDAIDRVDLMRAVHTLKGNCAVFGAQIMASACHEFESLAAERAAAPDEGARGALGDSWAELKDRIGAFLAIDEDVISMTRHELEELCTRVSNLQRDELMRTLDLWLWEPAARRLARLGEQVSALAARLGKGEIDVAIDGGRLRFDPEQWNLFWASLVHLVRNSVDHGIEPVDARRAAGKPERARMTLRARLAVVDAVPEVVPQVVPEVVIEVGDDGRGIDWDAVARKARQRGLDTSSHAALEAALFLDGFSTRDAVGEHSGRGVGLSAVRAACARLGGAIEVVSEPGQGTTVRFRLPASGVIVF
jgi:two-component system, chemotaxis family, sensor kinase CheA